METFKIKVTLNTSDRIKGKMQALNLKAVDLVNKTGAGKSAVSKWVNGAAKPTGTYLLRLSEALQCEPEWLLTGKSERVKHSSEVIALHSVDAESGFKDNDVYIPLFESNALPVGCELCDIDNISEQRIKFAKSVLESKGVDHKYAYCLFVVGNSMEPVLPDNSMVAIDSKNKEISDGKMYAMNHNGIIRVKMIYQTPKGFRFRSFNDSEYPDEHYDFKEFKDINILGRVFWYSSLV